MNSLANGENSGGDTEAIIIGSNALFILPVSRKGKYHIRSG